MDISKLFESLDAKVFTPELRESLETQFNEAVEIKSALMVQEKIAELEAKEVELIESLTEKAEEFKEIQKAEMVDALDKYLERVVEEFIAESKDALTESIKMEKADMIIEAFDAMLVAGGVEVSRIVEAKDSTDLDAKLEESVSKNDALVEEIISLKAENDSLLKAGVIAEMKEGLSLLESEKFEKLAALVEFTKDEIYAEKLQTIKESVKGAVEKEEIQDINESAGKPAWAHLV